MFFVVFFGLTAAVAALPTNLLQEANVVENANVIPIYRLGHNLNSYNAIGSMYGRITTDSVGSIIREGCSKANITLCDPACMPQADKDYPTKDWMNEGLMNRPFLPYQHYYYKNNWPFAYKNNYFTRYMQEPYMNNYNSGYWNMNPYINNMMYQNFMRPYAPQYMFMNKYLQNYRNPYFNNVGFNNYMGMNYDVNFLRPQWNYQGQIYNPLGPVPFPKTRSTDMSRNIVPYTTTMNNLGYLNEHNIDTVPTDLERTLWRDLSLNNGGFTTEIGQNLGINNHNIVLRSLGDENVHIQEHDILPEAPATNVFGSVVNAATKVPQNVLSKAEQIVEGLGARSKRETEGAEVESPSAPEVKNVEPPVEIYKPDHTPVNTYYRTILTPLVFPVEAYLPVHTYGRTVLEPHVVTTNPVVKEVEVQPVEIIKPINTYYKSIQTPNFETYFPWWYQTHPYFVY